jgi:inosine triphosphate pyrophosphatase
MQDVPTGQHVVLLLLLLLLLLLHAAAAGPYIKWFLEKLGHDGLNRMLGEWQASSPRR